MSIPYSASAESWFHKCMQARDEHNKAQAEVEKLRNIIRRVHEAKFCPAPRMTPEILELFTDIREALYPDLVLRGK